MITRRSIVYNFCIPAFLSVFFLAGSVHGQDLSSEERYPGRKPRTVAFIADGEDNIVKEAIECIEKELTALIENRYPITYIDDVFGEYDAKVIRQKLDTLLREEKVDLIIVVGMMTGLVVLDERDLPKPVILTDVYDIDVFSMPFKDGTSGRKNLTYLATKGKLENDIKTFKELVPFKKLHVLIDREYVDTVKKVLRDAGDIETEVVFVEYGRTAEETLAELDKELDTENVEAFYLTPSDLFTGGYRHELITGLDARDVRTFSRMGSDVIEEGILAGLVPRSPTKFARRVALNADRIFRGEKAEDLPVLFKIIEERLVINARTAREIGVSIPFSVMLDAKVLYAFEGYGEELTWLRAVEEALENNTIFRIRDEEIKVAKENNLLRWADYLPFIEYNLQFNVFDSETAKQAVGLIPKRYLKNRFTLNQLIFSDPALVSIENSRKQIQIQRLRRHSQSLDITEETSWTYLDYLIRKSLYKVDAQNLEATRQHLRVAEKRFDIGIGAKEEKFRWQSEVADKEARLIRAESEIYTARVELNQLMDRPQEMPFAEEDVGMELTRYYLGGGEIKKFVRNENMLGVFINFMVENAMVYSPEIKALQISVEQHRNTKDLAIRKFFLPEARLDGYLDQRLEKKYYATIPENDHDDWYMGINVSYPIFEGGAKGFNVDKQRAEMDGLIFKKYLTQQFTELNVRTAAYKIYFSFPNIKLSYTAMVNATKNYDILQKKYAKGTASITDLIDAQRDKFTREGQAVIAVYRFLQDLTELDRAVGRFMLFATRDERIEWLEELREYFAEKGIEVSP